MDKMASELMKNSSSIKVEKSVFSNNTETKKDEQLVEKKSIKPKSISVKDQINTLTSLVHEMKAEHKMVKQPRPRIKPQPKPKMEEVKQIESVVKNEAEQKAISDVITKEVEKEEKPILEEEMPVLENMDIKVENKEIEEPLPFENYKRETGMRTVKSRVNIQQVQNNVYNTKRILPILGRKNNPYNKW